MKPLEPDEVLQLSEHHRWKARPGCRIFVADRGKLRLDFPEGWVWSKDDDSFEFRDREPPDDRCTLAVSLWVAPGIAGEVPLAQLVAAALRGGKRAPTAESEVFTEQHGALELAWAEMRFVDPQERREALSRLCLAREGSLQALLTLDFWPEDEEWVRRVWDDLLASLELNRPIADPRLGPMEH
jgi:hypothetical protein